MTTARRAGKGWFVLDGIAGELPEELAAIAEERGDRRWLPFTQEVAEALLEELPGARLDQRAARCASKLQVGLDPAPATLMLVESYGESRFKLEVNWDPDTVGAFVELPAAEAHGRTLPIDPYLLEPLEHFIRLHGIDVGANAREALARLRIEHDAAIGAVRRSRASDADTLECEPRLGGELRPFQRAGVRYALESRRLFIADEQGLGKTVEALALLEEDDAFPAVVICPASLKLNWQREIQHWLPHRSLHVVVGTGKTIPKAEITVLNYEIVHAHRERLAISRPKALILDESHYVKNPAAKRTRAVRRLAEALPEGAFKLALTGTPVMNHPDELIAQLRILGRLEEFGSGARFKRRFQGAGAEERIHWHLRRTCFVRRLKKDVLPQLPGEAPGGRAGRARERARVPARRARRRRLAAGAAARAVRARGQGPGDAARRAAGPAQHAAAAGRARQARPGAGLDRRLPGVRGAAGRLRQPPRDPGDGRRSASRTRCTSSAPTRRVERDAAVQAFQDPDGPQLIVCSTRVAGQGITLTRASNVAFLDLEWSPAMHDQAEDRTHRIGQRDAVTAWYLLAAETIDETMAEVLARKRGIVGAVTDGRRDESEAVVQSVVKALRGKPLRRLRAVA